MAIGDRRVLRGGSSDMRIGREWRLRIAYVFVAVALFVALFQLQTQSAQLRRQGQSSCVDRIHQYDALHKVIIKQNLPAAPSKIIQRAFPQFRAFFTPGTPEYREAKRIADVKRDAALSVLGPRPDC